MEVGSIFLRDAPKILSDKEFKFGRKKMYKMLRNRKMIKEEDSYPSKKGKEMGLFKLVILDIITHNGGSKIELKTEVTIKGIDYIIVEMKKDLDKK